MAVESVKHYFVSGATGVVGSSLVPVLLGDPDARLTLLIRAGTADELAQRLERLYAFWNVPPDDEATRSRVVALAGDTTVPQFGLGETEYSPNSDNHSFDVHTGLSARMKNQSGPMLDAGLSGLISDLDERGLLKDTLVLAVGEFGRSPKRGVSTSGNGNSDDGRDHWPYCYTGLIAGAGVKRGLVWGKSDQTASAPVDNPVHPIELLATIYHSVGMNPRRTVYNHLNQPREMVSADAVTGILS